MRWQSSKVFGKSNVDFHNYTTLQMPQIRITCISSISGEKFEIACVIQLSAYVSTRFRFLLHPIKKRLRQTFNKIYLKKYMLSSDSVDMGKDFKICILILDKTNFSLVESV